MNKYQDALSRIKRFSNYWNNTERVNNNLEPHFNILQELVDKATGQKKHIENCKEREYLNHNYCYACGQKLDWSDTD